MGSLNRLSDRQLRYSQEHAFAQIVSLLFLMLLLLCAACDTGVKKRPIGYVRLSSAGELAQQPETYFSEARVLVRYDEGGFSAMSTACTYDLSALTRRGEGSSRRWASSYSSSSYDDRGHVREGPARADLPFYKLHLAAGTYGGTPDTLFVEIGTEVDSAWRLPWVQRH